MTNISTKPYLLRAIFEWCVDQGFTPHIAVLVDERTVVPAGYAQDGQIVLNLGSEATQQLVMGNDLITFQARFGGVAHALSVPVSNVLAIYARENGHGMAFEPEAVVEAPGVPAEQVGGQQDEGTAAATPPAERRPPAGRNHLKIVK
ncbi:ClpXP protease specificity-enhancing factor [Aromatoleum anaerobium]|uniref:ClpXP protease specificity-enhancing factor n=1 Tax=Aromatoleum anaerobium TaxID=182180 RepID=A0ABX1PJS6_9RHOO|nr:ClpXP protease specificity-enhancing factor [Aromatoleum anaerobium]MCK0506854.1 ClpXP protease specificity-enhancing factor [Aromatoleum anaerobium]